MSEAERAGLVEIRVDDVRDDGEILRVDHRDRSLRGRQELRASKVGRVVVDSRVDKPWSQYFCCMLLANREFIRRNPVATKRAVRAILKANDICATEPDRIAQRLVDWGYAPRYDYAVQTLKELPYPKWRDFDAEDTIRFYALRLREARLIKSTPQRIITDGTDWRFLEELKKQLK